MGKSNLEQELQELLNEFGTAADPQYKKLSMLAKKARENNQKIKKSVGQLQESLDYLRICIKYQLFDLEATRRENKYLRDLLNDKNR